MGVEREEFERMKQEMIECKSSVHQDIKELKQGHKDLQLALKEQSSERRSFNGEIREMLEKVIREFKLHTDDEMETIKNIYSTLKTLVEQTDKNTGFISSATHNAELEARVAKRINEINKPRAEMWNKVKLTAISVITTAVLVAIGSGIMVIYKMYSALNGGL